METTEQTCERLVSPKKLAQRLQALRLKTGWKLEEVADRAGVARSTLYHLERGTTPQPRAATVHRLAEAYGVAVDVLIAPADEAAEGRRAPLEFARRNDHWNDPEPPTVHPGDSLSPACRFDRATNPSVESVARSDPQLFSGWSPSDWEELYSNFGTGGALNEDGVRLAAAQINANRETVQRLRILLHTHLSEVAAGMVDTLFRMVCPEAGAAETECEALQS